VQGGVVGGVSGEEVGTRWVSWDIEREENGGT
jgi:hypothetical protein